MILWYILTMFNILRHISLKRMLLNKAQTIMTVSGICLGVSAVVSIGIVNKSVLNSFEDSITRVTGRASLQITGSASGFPEDIIERVRKVPGVEYAVPVIETRGIVSGVKERAIMILGIDVLQDRQIREYSLSGEDAEIPDLLMFLARADSILITKEMALREGIKSEQIIRIQTVRGILPFRVRGMLNPEGPAKAMSGNVAVMDIFAAQKAFGKEGRIDRIDVSVLKGSEIGAVQDGIKNSLPQGYGVDTPAGRTAQVGMLLSHFQKNINTISFIAVFVGMYLIYNAVSISVVQRRKEIGILRALGATRRGIVGLFMGETFMNAVAGSGLGIGLGFAFARMATGAVTGTVSDLYMSTGAPGIMLSWKDAAAGFGTGIAASMIAAFLPALSSSRITPISAIRSLPYTDDRRSGKRAWIFAALCAAAAIGILIMYETSGAFRKYGGSTAMFSAIIFLMLGVSLATPSFLKGFLAMFQRLVSPISGAAGRLAGLNISKNIGRNSVAAAAIFYGISVFVSSSTLINSTKQSVQDWVEATVRGDIIVTSGHPIATSGAQNIPMPVEMWKEMEQAPGVLSADPYRRLYIQDENGRILLVTFDIKRRMEYSPLVIANGKRDDLLGSLPGRDSVAISESLAARYRLAPGDSILLPTPQGPVRFSVAAVMVDYRAESGSVLMDMKTYQRHWKDFVADSFSVRVKPGINADMVRREILNIFGSDRRLFVLPAKSYRDEIQKVVDQAFVLVQAINVLTLLIAGFGIVITMLASVLERTREIGILRSLGMMKRQVAGVVVFESVILGAAGGILGTAAGMLTGWMSMEGFLRADYGASMQYRFSQAPVILSVALSALLSAAAGLYPALRAARTNIVEALSYE